MLCKNIVRQPGRVLLVLDVRNMQSNIGENCCECYVLSFETSLTFCDTFTNLDLIDLETQSA